VRTDPAAALLVVFLAAVSVVFVPGAVDSFEQVKALLLLTTVFAVAALFPQLLDPRGPGGGSLPGSSVAALAYLGSAVLSTVFSTSPLTSLVGASESHAGLGAVVSTVALFFVARRLSAHPGRRRVFATAVVIGATAAAAYGALQAAGLDPLHWTREAAFGGRLRPFGTMGHPNHLGGLLAMVLPVDLWLARSAFRRGRPSVGIALGLGAALSAGVLVTTLSRAAWVAALAGLAVFLSVTLERRRAWIAVATLLGLAGAALVLLSTAGPGSFAKVLEERLRAGVAVGPRAEIWKAAGDAFRESPMLGSGLDTFALAFARHRPRLYWTKEYDATPAKAHNEILHALATQGLVGAGAWLLAVGGGILLGVRALRRAPGEERGLVAAMLGSWIAFLVLAQTGFAVVVLMSILAVWAATFATLVEPLPRVAPVKESTPALRWAWRLGVGAAWVAVVLLPLMASVSAKRAETASPEQSVALLDWAEHLDPLRVLYSRRLGLALLHSDASEPVERTAHLLRSREVLARAARLVPADAYGWASLSASETKLAAAGLLDREQPFRSLDEAVRRDPVNATFRIAGANAALELGDLARARRYAEDAAAALPDFAPPRAQLAHVAAREGRVEDAIGLLRESLSLQWYGQTEAHHVGQANLVSLLVRAGRLAEAEEEARSLVEGAPTFAPGRYQLGRALEGLGRMDEAVREYEATLRLDPSHRGAREALRARSSP
jgi:O-antigen ligase/tetratricopeptide (TPR) repeat protein